MVKVTIPKIQSRLLVSVPEVQTTGETLTLSFASPTAVDRGSYLEILDLAGVNLSRVQAGSCPWLWNHNPDQVLGVVEKAWRQVQKLYATVRPGENPVTERYLGDIRAGLIRQTSCRYSIEDYQQSVDSNGREVVLIKKWTLLEVSSVSVPADPTTGVGRDFDHKNTGERPMPSAARISREREQAERDRIRAIEALGRKFASKLPSGKAQEIVQRGIDQDLTEDEVRDEIAELFFQQAERSTPISTHQGWNGTLGMSSREIKEYSLLRAIQAQISGDWSQAGLEREAHRALEGQGFKSNGLLVPTEGLRLFSTSTAAKAGNLVGTDHAGFAFVEALRSRSVSYLMGATRFDDLQGDLEIPRQTGVTSLGWVAEDAELPESEGTFDTILLKPKTLGAWCQLSRMVATQSDPNLESLILQDFAASLATAIDAAALAGTGLSNQPIGILNTAGIGSIPLGTDGGQPTWESIVGLERELAIDNADAGALGYVTSPRGKARLKTTLKAATAGSDYLWSDTPQMDGMGLVNGYRALSSSTVPSNLTKGTGSNLSAIIFGNWSDLILASWGVLSLETDPFADFRRGRIACRVLSFMDISVRHAESFSATTDMITA